MSARDPVHGSTGADEPREGAGRSDPAAAAATSGTIRAERPIAVQRIHHVAYRCRDAARTVAFYRDVLGMDFQLAIAEDRVPSTGEPHPYMHVFLDAGAGNVLAFFELPESPPMDRDRGTPPWVQHIAFRVEDLDALEAARERLRDHGLEVTGPVDHTLFKSIYFFDPDGHRVELAADTARPGMHEELRRIAPAMLEEWSRTRRAPRHAQWLHDGSGWPPRNRPPDTAAAEEPDP